jgi:hypothetical protein
MFERSWAEGNCLWMERSCTRMASMQGNGAQIAAVPLGIGVALLAIVLWWALSHLTAWMSGWSRLAQRFRFDGQFDGELIRWVYGLMRWYTKYGGVLVMGANAQGIYLRTIWALRVGHPPLLIQWSDVEMEDRTRWLREGTQFTLGREEQVPLWVLKRVGDRLLKSRLGGTEQTDRLYSEPTGFESERRT